MDGKLLRGNIKEKGDSGKTKFVGLLLMADQSDRMSKVGDEEVDHLSKVRAQCSAQSHPTLCDPTDCSLPGSFVHGI